MKNLLTLLNALPGASDEAAHAPQLRLRAVSPRSGDDLLPGLLDAIDRACGWVLSRQMISATSVQLQVETQGRALVDLYASFLGQGLELSRESHLLLAERCSCAHLHRAARRSIVSLSLEVSLPADLAPGGEWMCPVLA